MIPGDWRDLRRAVGKPRASGDDPNRDTVDKRVAE